MLVLVLVIVLVIERFAGMASMRLPLLPPNSRPSSALTRMD